MSKKKEEQDSKHLLSSFLKTNKDDHYNFEEEVDYKVSTGSLQFDLHLGGGFGPGLHRFCGINESGKEQPVSEPVLSEHGWKPIGDIKVGDKIFGSNGELQTVLGVYPQGKKDVYEVKFNDGRVVRCGLDHLWETSSFTERHSKSKRKSVKDLKSIKETLRHGSSLNHSVRVVKAIRYPKKDLKVDPYLLGVLLGDGCLSGKVEISNVDDDLWQFVDCSLKKNYKGSSLTEKPCGVTKSVVFKNQKDNPLIKDLKELNLYNLKSEDKFIPEEYLTSSIDQRLELLRGLVDTDSYVSIKKSEVIYYSVSKKLADGVTDLVRSLGGIARIRFKNTSYINKNKKRKVCKDCYLVSFYLPDGILPCRIKRKVDRIKPREINFHNFIKDVKKVGEEESVCIKVSNLDSLYVTKDYILTHNTSSALEVIRNFLKMPNTKAVYIKAEGRLGKEMMERSGVKFVFSADEWEDGTCFVFESNIYETVVDLMRRLVASKDGKKYTFLLDSVDGLIRKDDLDKGFEDSAKVAGGAVIAATFMKKVSIALAKRGHMGIFISQVRADIKLDPYSKAPIRQTSATGGNALLHFANWIIEFQARFSSDIILQNPSIKKMDSKTNPPVGHYAKAIIKKSPNETTNTTVSYPIKYGRKNGKSIWIEKEVVDLMYAWEFIKKEKAWISFTEDFKEILDEDFGIDFDSKIQGDNKLFELIESNPKLSQFLINYFKQVVNELS